MSFGLLLIYILDGILLAILFALIRIEKNIFLIIGIKWKSINVAVKSTKIYNFDLYKT